MVRSDHTRSIRLQLMYQLKMFLRTLNDVSKVLFFIYALCHGLRIAYNCDLVHTWLSSIGKNEQDVTLLK